MLTGYTPNFPNDVMLDAGVFYIGSTIVGATKGEPKFENMWELQNLDFDGKHAPIKGNDRKFYGPAKISATLLEMAPAASGNQIVKLEAGSSEATTGVTPNTLTTVTPKAGGVLYPAADYIANLRLIYERGIVAGAGVKKYVAILFPSALITKWSGPMGHDKGQATLDIEFEARKDMASGTTADAPYLIEYRESLP